MVCFSCWLLFAVSRLSRTQGTLQAAHANTSLRLFGDSAAILPLHTHSRWCNVPFVWSVHGAAQGLGNSSVNVEFERAGWAKLAIDGGSLVDGRLNAGRFGTL